jgi:hypothetical protein
MKTFFKWVAWGIGGLIVLAIALNVWSGKSEVEIIIIIVAGFTAYAFYILSKAITEVERKQNAQSELLHRIIDNIDRNSLSPYVQEMLSDFLQKNTKRINLNADEP